jgi:hypothetical protein
VDRYTDAEDRHGVEAIPAGREARRGVGVEVLVSARLHEKYFSEKKIECVN